MPDLVMAFITAPLKRPYSASKELVIRRNSATESRFGITEAPMPSFADVSAIHVEGVRAFPLPVHGDQSPDDDVGATPA